MKEREKFGTRLGFILVSAGCAVGLGNVWKFPYICGENGGAAFIIIYLFFLLLLGFPIIMCEFAVGRASGVGTGMCFDKLEPKGGRWHRFKWGAIGGSYILMMFYTMVGGWMLYYAYKMATGQLSGLSKDKISGAYDQMLQSPGTMAFWMMVAIVVSLIVCAMGVQNGVERITKVMMLALFLLIVVLAVNSVRLDGAMEGVKFYLVPNLDAIRERGLGTVIFDAMTHAFFTLSVGIGAMEIFGSYLKRERSIGGEAANIVFLDTFVAIMAGLIIIPACFAYGVQPDAGPSLLFKTLPNVFSNMAGGRVWGTAFFIFMSFAALSTIIAVFEEIISFYIDLFGYSRKKAVCLNLVVIPLLSLPAVFVLFCTRKNGWGWQKFIQEVNDGEGMKIPGWLQNYMAYVLPAVIVIVYLKGYYDTFAGRGLHVLIPWMIFAVVLLMAIFFIVFAKTKPDGKEVKTGSGT